MMDTTFFGKTMPEINRMRDRITARDYALGAVEKRVWPADIAEYAKQVIDEYEAIENLAIKDTIDYVKSDDYGTVPMPPSDNLAETLAERGARYGDFTDHARICQNLQNVMRAEQGWDRLSDDKKQALTVIADKIARILSGDPEYKDNWHDIQGYAKLAEDRCNEDRR